MIVGVIDSGITPEAPSFADRGLDPPASWDGTCQSGQEFPVTSCSDKLIGARYFVEGFGEESLPHGPEIAAGDPLDSAPEWEAKRALKLRWSGADGTEPLRGVVTWHAGSSPSEANRLGASVVEVAPTAR